MRVLADKLHCSFITLEPIAEGKSAEEGGLISVQLKDRGQVLAPGTNPISATIILLYERNHFNLLVPCKELAPAARYQWILEAETRFFEVHEMLPDHSCGWQGTALALNHAKVPVPEGYGEPPERFIFFVILTLY